MTDLAEVIQGDPLVLAKVVGAANMFAYNPNGVQVTSVTQAIHVIGYERIRTLAMSLMLVEQVARTHTPEAQREYAAQSLLAGCVAQNLAAGRARLDKQQAFICAALRNFGQIVLASCMPGEFLQLREESGGEPDDAAYRRVFGLTPLKLGHQLLDAANLPEEILQTLREIPTEAFAVLGQKPEDQMMAIAAFAGELAALTLDPRSDPREFATTAKTLAQRYEHVLPLLHEELHRLMETSAEQLDQIARTFRLKTLPPRLTARLVKCRNAVDPNRPAPPATSSTRPPMRPVPPAGLAATLPRLPVEPAATAPGPAAPLPVHDWSGSLKRLTGLLRQPERARGAMQDALMEILCTGLGARECLIFGAEPGSRVFPLENGQGETYRRLRAGPPLGLLDGERTVLGVCLARNENIIIHHAREEKIMAYLPVWLKTPDSPGAFVLLPLSDGARVGGVVVVGWAESRQIVLEPECVRNVRSMLALICRHGTQLAA